jgi:hypothetical protein
VAGFGVLGLLLSPTLYNRLVLAVSGDLPNGDLSATQLWAPFPFLDQFIGTMRMIYAGPWLAAARLFPQDERLAGTFAQFAYIDSLLGCLGLVVATLAIAWTAIPQVDSCSLKHGRQFPRGSCVLAGLLVLVVAGVVSLVWIKVFSNGSFFDGARHYCAQYSGYRRHRHCIAWAESTFSESIAQIGWALTVTAAALTMLVSCTISAVRATYQK